MTRFSFFWTRGLIILFCIIAGPGLISQEELWYFWNLLLVETTLTEFFPAHFSASLWTSRFFLEHSCQDLTSFISQDQRRNLNNVGMLSDYSSFGPLCPLGPFLASEVAIAQLQVLPEVISLLAGEHGTRGRTNLVILGSHCEMISFFYFNLIFLQLVWLSFLGQFYLWINSYNSFFESTEFTAGCLPAMT